MLKHLILPVLWLLCNVESKAQNIEALIQKADSLLQMKQFERAIQTGEEIMALSSAQFGEESPAYAEGLFRVGRGRMNLWDWKGAVGPLQRCRAILEKTNSKGNARYADVLFKTGKCLRLQEDFPNARQSYLEAMDIFRNIYGGEENDGFLQSLHGLSICNNFLGNNEEALSETLKLNNILKKLGRADALLAGSYLNLGNIYLDANRFARAEESFCACRDLYRDLGQVDSLACKGSLGLVRFRRGDLSNAVGVFEEILDVEKKSDASNDPMNYLSTLENLGLVYSNLGFFKKAADIYHEQLLGIEHALGIESAAYSEALGFYAVNLYNQQKQKEALPLLENAVQSEKKNFGNTGCSLVSLATCHLALNDIKRAEQCAQQFILENKGRDSVSCLPAAYAMLGYTYLRQDQLTKAAESFQSALSIYQKTHTEDGFMYQEDLRMLAGTYELMGDLDAASRFFRQGHEAILVQLQKAVAIFSADLQLQLFRTLKGNAGSNLWSFAFRHPGLIPTSAFVQSQLLTKNMLIESAQDLKNGFQLRHDSAGIELYTEWLDLKENLACLYVKQDSSSRNAVPRLQEQAGLLEKSLARRSSRFAQYTAQPPAYNWQEIRAALQPGEVAVDIARFNYCDQRCMTTDTIIYTFLVISPDTRDQPDLIFLPNGNELESLMIEQYRAEAQNKQANAQMSNMIYSAFWKQLEPFLAGAQRVFVASDGVFNKINIQTLRGPDGKYLLDVYDLKRVANLKDILVKRNEKDLSGPKTAFLLGNPAFKRAGAPTGSGAANPSVQAVYREVAEGRGLNLLPLPGSEQEVKNIAALFQKNGWTAHTFLGKDATEAALKNEQSPTVVHLATHGYFLEDEHKNNQTLHFQAEYIGQNPLLRSMLFFAGAQNTLDQVALQTHEDGILTAYEAQNLNLENTELVVLSACSSGLGKVENGESVMGLQRAFQVAGAKTVIMSLWGVDDAVTQLLMRTFYENWLAGKSKATAFRAAQRRIKEQYPQPYFWGAFVIMGSGE